MASTGSIRIHPSNEAQARAWDGDEGAYWAARADHFDRCLTCHHGPFMDACGIGAGDRVLDVGCGSGQTTRDAARHAGDGWALGVDLSSAMIEEAKRRAAVEGVANAAFEQADASVHPFEPGAFDAAISRTGAMFFGDAVAGFANVARALRPGGRLVLLTWQPLDRNEWVREIAGALTGGRGLPAPPPGAPGPFSLSDPERVREVLGAAGFTGVGLAGQEAPMWFGATPEEAHAFIVGVSGWMADGLDDDGRRRALDALRATLDAHATPDGVQLDSAAWLVTAVRT